MDILLIVGIIGILGMAYLMVRELFRARSSSQALKKLSTIPNLTFERTAESTDGSSAVGIDTRAGALGFYIADLGRLMVVPFAKIQACELRENDQIIAYATGDAPAAQLLRGGGQPTRTASTQRKLKRVSIRVLTRSPVIPHVHILVLKEGLGLQRDQVGEQLRFAEEWFAILSSAMLAAPNGAAPLPIQIYDVNNVGATKTATVEATKADPAATVAAAPANAGHTTQPPSSAPDDDLAALQHLVRAGAMTQQEADEKAAFMARSRAAAGSGA